jgi:hypothetical protein
MVRLVRGRPLLHIFMVKSNEAVNKSAPRSVELFTIRTKKNASVELALCGLLNNSRLPISAPASGAFDFVDPRHHLSEPASCP